MLSCLALVLALAVPCLAVDFDPRDYIETEYIGEEITTLEVSIPADAFTGIHWIAFDNDVPESWENPYAEAWASRFDLVMNGDGSSPEGYRIDCSPFASADYISIKDFVNGTDVSVDFNLQAISDWSILEGMEFRYQIYYFDYKYQRITVDFTNFISTDWFDQNEVSFTLNKPDGAMYMTFILQFRNVYQEMYNSGMENNLIFVFNSVNFTCDVATMKTQEQLTGETNRLLEKLINGYNPKPTLPPFHDSMQDSFNKEDQIIDQLDPDGVIGDLDAIQVTVLDRILLLANSFQMISLMFQAFLKVPVLEIIAYVSLLLGLLASLLGIGIAAGRAASRHEGRSGKKGK